MHCECSNICNTVSLPIEITTDVIIFIMNRRGGRSIFQNPLQCSVVIFHARCLNSPAYLMQSMVSLCTLTDAA